VHARLPQLFILPYGAGLGITGQVPQIHGKGALVFVKTIAIMHNTISANAIGKSIEHQ
jgi:hypothetical protein